MFSFLANAASKISGGLVSAAYLGLKPMKYFIDNYFRDKVTPVAGSVLYCDLWVLVEHSGIYTGDGKISNIVVEGLAESQVQHSDARDFTSKSKLGRKIYVSSDNRGAVGHETVSAGAVGHLGERSFYGLVVKNCHQFSEKCVNYVETGYQGGLLSGLFEINETWEPTIGALKSAARKKLGATKWRLWDWENENEREEIPEPDWQAINNYFENQPLNPQSIEQIRQELAATQEYEAEIADENVPDHIRQRLTVFRQTLTNISTKYEEVKNFLAQCPDAGFSYAQLKNLNEDFAALANTLKDNKQIKELVRKMGRDYISEEKKKQKRIPERSKSEVHGTHRSDDVMRVLPSELLNLEDETLEMLFYARLLEKNLLTYQLQGTTFVQREEKETHDKRTGAVVACLDTSGSMEGAPLLKAKALLLAISGILQKEKRALYVLLFGSSGQVKEFSMNSQATSAELLQFLQMGYGGGTDFETPLNRALDIIEAQKSYQKADVLMISDGDCGLSAAFTQTLNDKKAALDCSIYTVLCAGSRIDDKFSDEVVVL
ncbi:MAG: VWA domain-containing protein [Methylococcaceae bacterium]